MSTYNLSEAAANLNSLGAALLASGDRLNARALFGVTLDLVTRAANVPPQQQETPVQATFHCPAPPRFNASTPTTSSRTTSRVPVSRGMGSLAPVRQEEGPFIYNQALVFGPTVQITPSTLPFYSAVVMLNVGLTFHVKPSSVIDELSLRLASSFYEMAIYSLVKGLHASSSANLPFAVLLNNKAEAHFELGEQALCRQPLDGLWAIIYNQQIRPRLEDCELDGFLYNILCLLDSPLHASSA